MPRGVYQRKSANAAAKVEPTKKASKAKAKALKPEDQRPLVLTREKPPAAAPVASPVTHTQPVADVPPVADSDPAPAPTSAIPVVRLQREEPIRGAVENMSGETLKRYARQIGIQQRDVDNLTEDRLRQNCKAMIFAAMEDD